MVKVSYLVAAAIALAASSAAANAQVTTVNVQRTPITTTTTTTTVNPNGTSSTTTNITIDNFQTPPVPTNITPVPSDQRQIRDEVIGYNCSSVPIDRTGVIVARDPRYRFTGIWSQVKAEETQVAVLPERVVAIRTFTAVLPPAEVATMGGASLAAPARDNDVAQIMPTAGAAYRMTSAREMTLASGAMLVKGGSEPFNIVMPLGRDSAVVRVEDGTFAMVSNMNGHVSVANLADSHRNACMTLVTDRFNKKVGELPARIGQMIEIYPNSLPAGENRIVSYVATHQLRLSNGLTVETTRLNYARTMKRINLTGVMTASDFKRIMKTAAAVAYMDRDQNNLW